MLTFKALPCRADNYIWIMHDAHHVWVIDPSMSAPVCDYIAQKNLKLVDILITHHHYDHVEGIAGLLPLLTGDVVGASNRIEQLTCVLPAPSYFQLSFLDAKVSLLSTPGHTHDHVSYYLPDTFETPLLFCGDTMFSGGCGRLFDGTIEQLYASFQQIMCLPESTRIACAHEYTLSNLQFALSIDPYHESTQAYNNQVKCYRSQGRASLPTTLALEKVVNPFMRCLIFEPDWIARLIDFALYQGVSAPKISTPFDAFRLCRVLKDQF